MSLSRRTVLTALPAAVVQESLNSFLVATTFPCTPSSTEMAGTGPSGVVARRGLGAGAHDG